MKITYTLRGTKQVQNLYVRTGDAKTRKLFRSNILINVDDWNQNKGDFKKNSNAQKEFGGYKLKLEADLTNAWQEALDAHPGNRMEATISIYMLHMD